MNRNSIVITVIVAIAVGGVGFFGGVQYQKAQKITFSGMNRLGPSFTGSQQGNNRQIGQMSGRPVTGEIINIDANSITVKTVDGSNKIVVYSTSTKISKAIDAAVSDLKQGERITIIGTAGNNGTITAQSISVGNLMFGGSATGLQPGQKTQPGAAGN